MAAPRVRGTAGYCTRLRDDVEDDARYDDGTEDEGDDGLLGLRYHGFPANENDVEPTDDEEADEREPEEGEREALYGEREALYGELYGELYTDDERERGEERELYIVTTGLGVWCIRVWWHFFGVCDGDAMGGGGGGECHVSC